MVLFLRPPLARRAIARLARSAVPPPSQAPKCLRRLPAPALDSTAPRLRVTSLGLQRYFSSSAGSSDGDDGGKASEATPSGAEAGAEAAAEDATPIDQTPATQTVPEVWPEVPVIAINKNPVFPREGGTIGRRTGAHIQAFTAISVTFY